MKQVLASIYLSATVGLSMLVGSLSLLSIDYAFAQETSDVTVNIAKSDTDDAGNPEEGFSVSFSIGEDSDSAEKKLEKLAQKLSVLVGDEATEDLQLKLDGMSAEKKKEIVDSMSEGFRIDRSDMDGLGAMESIVALTAVILIFGMPVIILLLVLWFGSRKRKQKMELVRTYLDAGKDVPEQVLVEFSGASKNSLRGGLTPLAVGIGLIFASQIIEDATPLAAIGLIPLFIGILRLIYWKYETDTQKSANL